MEPGNVLTEKLGWWTIDNGSALTDSLRGLEIESWDPHSIATWSPVHSAGCEAYNRCTGRVMHQESLKRHSSHYSCGYTTLMGVHDEAR